MMTFDFNFDFYQHGIREKLLNNLFEIKLKSKCGLLQKSAIKMQQSSKIKCTVIRHFYGTPIKQT